METPETRAKLANAIQTLRSQGREAEVQNLVGAYKAKYRPQTPVSNEATGLVGFGKGILQGAGETLQNIGNATLVLPKKALGLQDVKTGINPEAFVPKTTSQKVGKTVERVAEFLAPQMKIAKATAVLPTVARVASRAIPDVGLALAQSGGDVKSGAVAGITSAVSDAVLGGKAKAVRGILPSIKQIGKVTSTGYVADVASGVAGQRGEDRTGAKALIPGAGTVIAGTLGTTMAGVQGVKNFKDPVQKVNKIVSNREKELQKLEDSYQAVRKVTDKTKSQGIDPKKILAETDLLNGAVDNTGTLRTQNASIELNDFIRPQEKVISDTLNREGVLVKLSDVKAKLLGMVNASGIKGGAKLRAIKNVEDDIAGLMLEADSTGKVPLSTIHDAKIDKYANINFLNPESKRVDKAIAKGFKELVESNTRSADVRNLNRELQQHYSVLDLLEKLDGKKVEGGRLGKYFAQTVGGIVGSHFGPLGAIIGAEAGAGIKGTQMASKFGGKTGIPLKQSEDMQRAVMQSKLPKLGLPAPRSKIRTTVSTSAPIPLRDTTRLPDEAQAMSANQSYSSNNLGNRNTNQYATIIPTRIGISKSITVPKGSSIDQTRKIVNNHLESTLQAISDTPTFDMIQANPQAFYRQQIQDIAMGLKAENPKYARLSNSIASIDASKINDFETLASKIREKLNQKTLMETITGKGIPNRQGGFIKNPLAGEKNAKYNNAEDYLKKELGGSMETIGDSYLNGEFINGKTTFVSPKGRIELSITEKPSEIKLFQIIAEEKGKGSGTDVVNALKKYSDISGKKLTIVKPNDYWRKFDWLEPTNKKDKFGQPLSNIDKNKPLREQVYSLEYDPKSYKSHLSQSDLLIQEAKKYKSAEEFVKAQEDKLYIHGTRKKIEGNLELKSKASGVQTPERDAVDVLYVTPNTKTGKMHSRMYTKQDGITYAIKLKPEAKIFDYTNPAHRKMVEKTMTESQKNLVNDNLVDGQLSWMATPPVKNVKALGFDGMKQIERKAGEDAYSASFGDAKYSENAESLMLFNKNVFEQIDIPKTKSQLEEIWKKANKSVLPKGTK